MSTDTAAPQSPLTPTIVNDPHALDAFGKPDAAIALMAQQYLPLKIDGVKDAAGFKAVHEARMVVKNKRVAIEKTRKDLKADAVEYGRKVDAEAKRITALLEPIETHLQKEEDAYKAEQDRIKNEARLKAEAEAKAKREAEEAAQRAEQQRIRQEQEAEAARLRAEREKIEAERQAIEEERRKAQEAIDAERRKLEEEQRKIAEAEAEKRRADELERAKAEAAERARVETEQRIAREAEEAKAKAEREAAEKARREAARPDGEKLLAVAKAVDALDVPDMSTDSGQVASELVLLVLEKTAEKIREIVHERFGL